MTAYTIRRLAQGLIVVIIVTFLTLIEAHMRSEEHTSELQSL